MVGKETDMKIELVLKPDNNNKGGIDFLSTDKGQVLAKFPHQYGGTF